jgi:hypothetical protein
MASRRARGREPAVLLVVRAEQRDGLHGEAGLDTEEGPPLFLRADARLIATVGIMILSSATAIAGSIRAVRAWASRAAT